MVFHRTGKTSGTWPWTETTFRQFNTVPQLILSISSQYRGARRRFSSCLWSCRGSRRELSGWCRVRTTALSTLCASVPSSIPCHQSCIPRLLFGCHASFVAPQPAAASPEPSRNWWWNEPACRARTLGHPRRDLGDSGRSDPQASSPLDPTLGNLAWIQWTDGLCYDTRTSESEHSRPTLPHAPRRSEAKVRLKHSTNPLELGW